MATPPPPPPSARNPQQPPATDPNQNRLQILNRQIRVAGLALLADRKGHDRQPRRPALGFLFTDNTTAAITTAGPGQQASRGLVLRRLDSPPDFLAVFADLARRTITALEGRGRGLHLTIAGRPGLIVTAADDGGQLELETTPAPPAVDPHDPTPDAAEANHLDALAKLVRDVRDKQRLYYQTKSPAVLAEAKALERRLDLALEATTRPVFVHQQQRRLFGE